jgi:hypothetical protein
MSLHDPALPAARHLLGPGLRPVLAAAVDAAGGELRGARPCQVLYRPGAELVVRATATVRWHDGRETRETLLAGTSSEGPPPGTLPVEADGLTVGVWRYPFDPHLPGLAAATDRDQVGLLLRGVVDGPWHIRARTYRPGRRAVLHVQGASAGVYLKVVPPREVAGLVARHEALAAHAPVPEVLAAHPDAGVLVLRSLPGTVLREVLRDGSTAGLGDVPRAGAIIELLHRLQAAPLPGAAAVRPPSSLAAGHAALLRRVLPSEAGRLDELVGRLAGVSPSARAGVTVHGDFHEAQLLLSGPTVVGLLDVDDAGPGDPADDVATMIGHLLTLGLLPGRVGRSITWWAHTLRRELGEAVGDAHLDQRVAAVVLGLATGPFRVQERGWRKSTSERLALASRLAARDERTLSTAS